MKRWPTTTLGELLLTLETGSRPKGGVGQISDGIPSVSGEHINRDGEFYWDTPKFITRDFFAGMKRGRIQLGDILIVKDGATTGKTAMVRDSFPFKEAAINEHVFLLRTDRRKVLPEYAGYFLFGPIGQQQILSSFRGAAIGGIPQDFVRKVHIPLAPLAEQERIVKLLDAADELRKLRAQADTRTAALLPALFNEMFGDPARNEMGWPVKPFGELVTNQDGRRKPVKASDRAQTQGEYPYYGASGIIDYVEKYLFDETALLIGEDGANLLARSTPIAFLAHGKYWVNNHAHVLTDNGNADLIFLCAALNQRDLTDFVTGSAQPKLNQANMNRIPIAVPPLTLQKEFAQRVTEIRELAAAQSASRQRLEALFQSMLHRAFNGEL